MSAAQLFVCFILIHVATSTSCRISTFRVTGRSSLFALACQCGSSPEFLGRSIRRLAPSRPDTIAQERLTVSCIEHLKPSLSRACSHSPFLFQMRASAALKTCMNRKPKRDNGELFRFNKEKCNAGFRELDEERKEVLLVCQCPQRVGYSVQPGVVQFVTDGSKNGASREQKLLDRCTRNVRAQLTSGCRVHPERFDLRAAQAFNVCCKRIRRQFPKNKLLCQAVVPGDVEDFNLTFA